MAGYVIHTPVGLTAEAEAEAASLGPSAVCAATPPDALARQVGLTVLECTDVTDRFYQTSCAFNDALTALEPALRAAEGNEVFEHDRDVKASMRDGIERKLLRRCLVVATKE